MKSILTIGTFGAFGAVAALFASACMTTPANPLADVSGFCQEKAKAECQVAAVCAVDPDACNTTRAALCNADATSAMASGVRKYTPGNAQACIDALNAAYGNNNSKIVFAALEGPGSITDKCERVFSGGLASDATCQSNYDCGGTAVCAPVGAATPGGMTVCAIPVPVAADGFCANPGDQCVVDQYCALQPSGAAQCQASAAAGQACGATMPCVSAERCVGSVCVARMGPGGVCTSDDDCSSVDPYCDHAAGGLCAIGLTFATGSSDCASYEPVGVVATPGVEAGVTDAASLAD